MTKSAKGHNNVPLSYRAGDMQTRKSTDGYKVMLNGGLVFWRLFKQSFVTASSTESEYIALPACIQKVFYYCRMLKELGDSKELNVVYEHNQPFVVWTTQDGRRNKLVEVHHHICQEAVA